MIRTSNSLLVISASFSGGHLRRRIITGLVVLAAALGTVAAIPAARAALSPSAANASATAPAIAGTPLARAHFGPQNIHPFAGVAPAATSPWFFFRGVSCLAVGNCIAVGSNVNGSGGHGSAIASAWNGTSWRPLPVQLPSGTTSAALFDVSCQAGGCVAVGLYRRGTAQYPLAQFWNGAALSLGRLPSLPSGTRSTYLQSVSCRSPRACLAVGAYNTTTSNAHSIALAESWNGTSWRPIRPPTPSTPFSFLDAVNCVSTTFCIAGGAYVTSNNTAEPSLALQWTTSGVHQAPIRQPNSGNGAVSEIDGISCTSTTACAATGDMAQAQSNGTFSPTMPYAEVLSPAGWSLTSISTPGVSSGFYNWVSCSSATSCMATGGFGPLATSFTQGHAAWASWDGSVWSVHAINPPPGQGAFLWEDTCLSPSYCVAVGTQGKWGTTTGLALTAFWNGSTWNLITTT
jgi:hypothetical protein